MEEKLSYLWSFQMHYPKYSLILCYQPISEEGKDSF